MTRLFRSSREQVASWQVGEKGETEPGDCARSPDIGGKPETGTRDETLQARTGKCVLEDGIDYSMLWEAVKQVSDILKWIFRYIFR